MSKKETHEQELTPLFESFLRTGRPDALTRYLVAQSNLPGRRANLELAQAFADIVGSPPRQESARLRALCTQLAAISPEQAPVNDAREFLPFCGALGLGALGAAVPVHHEPALRALHKLAGDPRWRMRKAVCFALQRLLAADAQRTVDALWNWIPEGSWLELRTVAAVVAEPVLLQEQNLARAALGMHQRIVERVQNIDARVRQTESFRTLRKGLGYTLSVVVQALPDEGFAWLAKLAGSQDRDVLWIVRRNLKKTRLARGYPDQVARLMDHVRRET